MYHVNAQGVNDKCTLLLLETTREKTGVLVAPKEIYCRIESIRLISR